MTSPVRRPRKTGAAVFADVVASLPEERRSDPIVLRVARQLADLEDLRVLHERDIRKRGVIETVKNGRQEFTRANPSVASLLKVVAEARRLRAELKLRPDDAPFDPDGDDQAAEREVDKYLGGGE